MHLLHSGLTAPSQLVSTWYWFASLPSNGSHQSNSFFSLFIASTPYLGYTCSVHVDSQPVPSTLQYLRADRHEPLPSTSGSVYGPLSSQPAVVCDPGTQTLLT